MPFQLIKAGDVITFANSGTPTQYTVSTVNYGTRVITFTTNPTVTAGATVYRYRAAGASYPCFSRYSAALTAATGYTPTDWQDTVEYWESIQTDLRRYGVYHQLTVVDRSVRITIEPQKVSIGEISMNHLISVMREFLNFGIGYAALGGEGCDFAIEVLPDCAKSPVVQGGDE